MAATVISRATLTDSTSPTTGDIWNAALVGTAVYDKIDLLFAASLTIARSSSGDIALTVENASNTAGSDAQFLASVAGTSAGDPYATFTVTAGASWSIGVDNSDSDFFKISQGTAISNNDFVITTGGMVLIADNANANMTIGLTINQAGNDDEILAFKSSDLAHGMTSLTETDTFGTMLKASAGDGGLHINGYSEATVAVNLRGVGTTDDTVKATTAFGYVMLVAGKKSGTTLAVPGANANLVAIRDGGGTTRFIFDVEGDMHYDGAAPANYDRWDDVALVRALDLSFAGPDLVESAWDRFVTYQRDDLRRAGIVSDGGFVNLTKHTRLLNGAIWQLHMRLAALEAT
jgi:hypothetical protein